MDAIFVMLVVAVMTLVFAVNLAPIFGHQVVVIRGGSMSPAIPLGSAVDVARVQPADLRPGDVVMLFTNETASIKIVNIKSGDVVMLKAPNGTIVTHRVTRLVTLPDGLYVETKGDANQTADATLQPVSEIAGRVDFSSVGMGYVIYLLTLPTGMASVLALVMTLLFAVWLLEDLELDFAAGAAGPPQPVPSASAAS